MREYRYEPVRYVFGVVVPTVFSLFIGLWAAYQFVRGAGSQFHVFIIVVTTFIVLDNYFALTSPGKVTDDDETIEFHSFGKMHSYKWEDLKNCRIRQYPLTKRIYLRIGNTGFTRGRYWLKLEMFNDGDELLNKLRETETRLHPEIVERMRRRPIKKGAK